MANAYIAKCGYDEVKDYRGKGFLAKVGNKKYKVFLRVLCDDFNLKDAIQFARGTSSVVMLEYQGSSENAEYLSLTSENTNGCYIAKVVSCGDNVTADDIEHILEDIPTGVVPIIQLPETFTDLQFVWKMCTLHERIRFCGGKLFCVEGCRLGCCGNDILEKKGIKSNGDFYKEGCSCGLEVVDLESIELEVTDKVEKITSSSSRKSDGSPKKQKQLLFSDLLKSSGVASL